MTDFFVFSEKIYVHHRLFQMFIPIIPQGEGDCNLKLQKKLMLPRMDIDALWKVRNGFLRYRAEDAAVGAIHESPEMMQFGKLQKKRR